MKWVWATQALTVLFSLAGVLLKIASDAVGRHGFWSVSTLSLVAAYCGLMAVYAFFWQKVIARLPLSTAYFGKSLGIFWSLVWAWLFFGESISPQNISGTMLIVVGMVLVMRHEF
jgi:drug/metabolite transporter (DMT)-like permease